MKILCKWFGHKYEKKHWMDVIGEHCSYTCKRCGYGGGYSAYHHIEFVRSEFGGNGGFGGSTATLDINGYGVREIKRHKNEVNWTKEFVATGKYIDVSNNCRTCFGSGTLNYLLISSNNKSSNLNVKCHDCGGTGKIKND